MSAADKLSMSLDDIIASQKNNNNGGGNKKNFRPNQNGGGNKKFQKFSNNNNNFKPKHNVAKVNHSHDDRVGGKFHGNKNEVERPLKVITIERPKVIQPGSQHQQQGHGGSVFERLGKAGTYVTFRNLKRSVQQNDVLELCRAVGDAKEVSLQHDSFGNVARVLFSNDRDAAACVAKYHGVTLDGLEMNVSIENPTQHVKSVFERLETSTGVTGPVSFDPSANVRAGIFGTALSSSSGPLSQKLFNSNNFVADADDDEIEEDEAEEEEEEDEGFVRKVTVAQGNRKITLGAAGRGGGRRQNNRGGRGGGRGNKFNNNNNNNNKRNNRQNNNNHTAVDLDDDLDQYMADR